MGLTRRSFLKKTLGSVAALPWIIPSSALGRDGAMAPSQRISIAQIGFGWIGGSHLQTLLGREDVQYIAGCDINKTRLDAAVSEINAKYAERYGKPGYRGCGAYGDFREVLARPDLDAVLIATPDHWHAIISVEAARAGTDIYCEKPLTLTVMEAKAVAQTVRRYGRVFQTGSQQRSNVFGPFRNACELVRNGRIGKVISIDVSTGDPPRPCDLLPEPTPPDIDWNMWVGQTPWRPYHPDLVAAKWRPFREYCGGGFSDMGAHHFDIAQWALDMDRSGPVEVLYPGLKEPGKISYRYANGVVMNHVGGNALGLTFHGTEGEIYVGRDGFRTVPADVRRAAPGPEEIHLYRSDDHHANWIECIRARRPCVADVETGARTAVVCHVGNIAYELQRSLKWDPEKMAFVDDDQANRLLGRGMRSPWRL